MIVNFIFAADTYSENTSLLINNQKVYSKVFFQHVRSHYICLCFVASFMYALKRGIVYFKGPPSICLSNKININESLVN